MNVFGDLEAIPLRDAKEARVFIREVALTLDPESRYVPELLALIDGAETREDVEARIVSNCRGALHARAAYDRMSLAEKLIANLITPETAPLRFTEDEVLRLRRIERTISRRLLSVLVVPCSRGEEAFSVAYYLVDDFTLVGVDAQPALVAYASELPNAEASAEWPEALKVAAPRLRSSIRFEVGDAFALSPALGTFDLILCRNFLGYFVETEVERCLKSLLSRLRTPGALFLDDFCLAKFAALESRLEAFGGKREPGAPLFRFG